MPLPADLIFHRYFVEQAIRHPDARRYLGKQDLDRLEPFLGSLLRELQRALNDGLFRQHGMAGDGEHPRYYLDYIDTDVMNALQTLRRGTAAGAEKSQQAGG